MKDVLYEVRCLKSNEDMILALWCARIIVCDHSVRGSWCARIISSFDFKHRTSYNTSFIVLTSSAIASIPCYHQSDREPKQSLAGFTKTSR